MTVYNDKSKFCRKVYDLRKKASLSVPELAQLSGLPLTMLEALEQGVILDSMMVSDAFYLAEAFGCEVYELFQ